MKGAKGLILAALVLSGCTTIQRGAGIGAAVGAGAGAVIGHQKGRTAEGAAIGAAVGGLGGALVGEQAARKFCPVCGASYTVGTQYCPKDGTELKFKQ